MDDRPYLFDNRSIVLTPNYYVQKMFMNNQGDYYYDGLVTFTTEDPLLSASTVYDSTTGDVIIKIANPGMNPSKARADLSGFKGLGSDAQCFILRGARMQRIPLMLPPMCILLLFR